MILPLHLCTLVSYTFRHSPPGTGHGLAFGAFFIWQLQAFLLGEEEEVLMSSRISLPAFPVWSHARGLTVTEGVLLPMMVLISQIEALSVKNDILDFCNAFTSCHHPGVESVLVQLWLLHEKGYLTPHGSDICRQSLLLSRGDLLYAASEFAPLYHIGGLWEVMWVANQWNVTGKHCSMFPLGFLFHPAPLSKYKWVSYAQSSAVTWPLTYMCHGGVSYFVLVYSSRFCLWSIRQCCCNVCQNV